MEINRFEGNKPEWLVPGETPFAFGRRQDFERKRGKEPIGACLPNQLSIFSLFLSIFSSFLSFLFFFLIFYFVIPLRWLLLWFLPCSFLRAQ